MKNIIKELWNGEINPQDTLVDNNPHYKNCNNCNPATKQNCLNAYRRNRKKNSKNTATPRLK